LAAVHVTAMTAAVALMTAVHHVTDAVPLDIAMIIHQGEIIHVVHPPEQVVVTAAAVTVEETK